MKRKWFVQAVMLLALLSVASAPWAEGVLGTGMDSPDGVVKARKLTMKAIADNMKDIGDKLKRGQVEDVAVNAGSIGAMAALLPPLFKEKYESAYPVEGSNAFYKGGAAVDFENASAQLKNGADYLLAAAGKNDKAGAQTGFEMLKSSCGACHSVFRGKY